MGIQAMVVASVVSAIAQADAAKETAQAQIEAEESAQKSRELARTMEFNDMMATNVVESAASGVSMVGSPTTLANANDNRFKLQRGASRITSESKKRGYKQRANQAQTMAYIKAGTTIIGGYNYASR